MNQTSPTGSRHSSFSEFDWEDLSERETKENPEAFVLLKNPELEQFHAAELTEKLSKGGFVFTSPQLTVADLKVIIQLKKSEPLIKARPNMERCLKVLEGNLWTIPYSLASRITLLKLEEDNIPHDPLHLLSSTLLGVEDSVFVKMPLSMIENNAKTIHHFIVYERLNLIEFYFPDLLKKDCINEPLSFGAIRKQSYKELLTFGVGTKNRPLREWAWKLTGSEQIRRFNFQELPSLAINYSILGLDDDATIKERLDGLTGEQMQTIFKRGEKTLFLKLPAMAYKDLPLASLEAHRWEIIFPKENIENESETYKERFKAIAPKKLNQHRDKIPVYLQHLLPQKK